MPVFYKTEDDQNWFLQEIWKKYEIKFGNLKFLLGIEIIRDSGSILIRQKSYIERKTVQFGVNEAKDVKTPTTFFTFFHPPTSKWKVLQNSKLKRF
jgi:hypothetical protein